MVPTFWTDFLAYSVDPDQTAPTGAVCSVSTLCAFMSASFRHITLLSNSRAITANFSGAQFFCIFTVYLKFIRLLVDFSSQQIHHLRVFWFVLLFKFLQKFLFLMQTV